MHHAMMMMMIRIVGIMLKILSIVLFRISLRYARFYCFYAVFSITIPYLQFKLPIKVSYLSYLMLVEPLKINIYKACTYFTLINAFIVF